MGETVPAQVGHRLTAWTALSTPTMASLVTFLLGGSTVVALALFRGGFYPLAWGWGALAAAAVGLGTLLCRRRLDLGRREWLTVGLLAGFVLWSGSTALRANGATRAVPALEREILYLAALWAALVVLQRRTAAALVHGLLAGMVLVSLDGLGTFLLGRGSTPDVFEGRLLYQPLGYANAMGVLAAIGVLLALGMAARAGSGVARAAAAASLVPLIAVVSFSASRAAAAALVVAGVLMLAVDPARVRLAATAVAVLPVPLALVWLASRSHVTDAQAPASLVSRDGRIVAAMIVLMAVAAAAAGFLLLGDGRRLEQRRWLVGIACVVAILGLAVGARGGPSLAFGDRAAYWSAALRDYRQHPLGGSGAGSFRIAWLQDRTIREPTLNAHSLYLETLAELGPLGLALLVGALALPLAAAVAARRQPFVPAALGAYAVFLLHAGLDWDWEMPAVTVTALLCAAVLLASSRSPASRGQIGPRAAAAWAVAASAVAVVAAVGLIGNTVLASAVRAAEAGAWTDAEHDARRASLWAPWSATPLLALGEAQLAQGDAGAAHRSFARAASRDADDWRIWYEFGRTGDTASQERALTQIKRLNPLALQTAGSH